MRKSFQFQVIPLFLLDFFEALLFTNRHCFLYCTTVQHSRLECYAADDHGYVWWKHQFCLSLGSNDLLWEATEMLQSKDNHNADTGNVSRKEAPLAEMHTTMCLLLPRLHPTKELGNKSNFFLKKTFFFKCNFQNSEVRVGLLCEKLPPPQSFLCRVRFYSVFTLFDQETWNYELLSFSHKIRTHAETSLKR